MNLSKTAQAKKNLIEINDFIVAAHKPFVQAAASLSAFRNNPELFPRKKKLLPLKYELKIISYAMNELLGRPVPSVLNPNHLGAMLAEAKVGNFTRLDQILGFASTETKENEILEMEQLIKMNKIMHNILKAKGLDYSAIIAESARIRIAGFKIWKNQRDDNARKEKQRRITKEKLNNQRILGDVKTVSPKSNPVVEQEKRSIDFGKIKTAKDHEHYRKSKRPTRI